MTEIREQGDVVFLFRPRAGVKEARGLDDVRQLVMVLDRVGSPRFRVLVVGRRRLPDPGSHEREWALVASVTDHVDELRGTIERAPGARPVCQGHYAIVAHGGHTHLAYALGQAPARRAMEWALNIRPQACYVLAVRNPEVPAPPGSGLPEHQPATYPAPLRERFGEGRFIPADPPELLDHPGVEVVVIGALQDAARWLGIPVAAPVRPLESTDLFHTLRA